ncbi:MAG TPA: HNH endonuclease [Methylophaga aminisulfidivorans]|uniref:HNH endonuclease n=1 Tax=Methylophaga aminisulfidivorans TaxID=230105 RepID=A0A7C2AGK8_9GAMM|nr:HNH endonuclease [Methylophaga aminisulfidivorans]
MNKSKRSRKQFILSQGADCDNWTWSWSFVNHKKKEVIFGAWDIHLQGGKCLIFKETWDQNVDGRKSAGYSQSFEHIRLVEEEGYRLKTFTLIHSNANKDSKGNGPAKMDGFIEDLQYKELQKISNCWYAFDAEYWNETTIAEEVELSEKYIEGASSVVTVNAYERNSKARKACIDHHGSICKVCKFNFEEVYGDIGKDYIHVHHVIPLNEIRKEYKVDPIKDLIPLCPNCHAMIHRTRPALEVSALIDSIRK